MGKKSDPPAAPDPQETASAQTGANVSTAIANTMMGQVNQVGPDGSLTYEQTDTYQWRDPNSGQMYTLPRFTATTTLSEDQQQLRDLDNETSIALGTLGRDAAGRVGEHLGQDLDISGVTARADRSGVGPVEYGQGPDSPILSGDSRSLPGLENYASDAGYSESGLDVDLQNRYQTDFSAERQSLEDQIYGQLDEQRGKDLESLRSQLYNQGVVEGSEQYSRAMEDFDRSVDDRRLSAMRESLGFTQAMTGMARDEASFANDATMQEYGVDANRESTNNAIRGQQLSDTNAATAANNANAQTLFGMGSDQLAYNNNIAQQGFGNEMAVANRNDQNANANFNESRIIADDQDRARASEIDELAWLRNQPINEIASLMSGSQVATPNFALAQPYAMPTTDIAGITQQGYNNEMAAYQQQQQQQQAMMGGLFGLGGAALGSPWLFGG